MFTGIIEEIGSVLRREHRGQVQRLCVGAKRVTEDLKSGDSVTVDGACQTAVDVNSERFWFESVQETLKRTTLGSLTVGDLVNLERSLRPSDRLSGHLVMGHVDGTGTVAARQEQGDSVVLSIDMPPGLTRYVTEKGSVAVDGVSLTVVSVEGLRFAVWLIPYTLKNTTLSLRKVGDRVNLEADILAKYVDQLLLSRGRESSITEEWLREQGF